MMVTKKKITVDRAIILMKANSDYHLAQLLNVSKQMVSFWRKRGYIGFNYVDVVTGAAK